MISERLWAWAEAGLSRENRADEIYPQLRQLTIIIPSFERPDYILRQVVHWAFREPSVVIMDGSLEPIGARLLDLLTDVPNIRYVASEESYVNRLKQACDLVETSYAMCLADDDLLLVAGLNEALGHLENTPGIVACMGQVVGVDYDDHRQSAYVFPYGKALEGYDVKRDDVVCRMRFGLDGYRTATSYAVYRTSVFREVWLDIDATACLEGTEYEHAIATYISGNLATVPAVYWMRSFEAAPVDSVIEGTRRTDFASWWNNQEYASERIGFVERLAMRLQSETGIGKQEAREQIIEVVGLILRKRHVGLVNKNIAMTLVLGTLSTLYRIPGARHVLMGVKATRLGRKTRSSILISLRGATVGHDTATRERPDGRPNHEFDDVVSFVNGFHAARDAADEERSHAPSEGAF